MDIELFESGMRWWAKNKPRWTSLHSFYEELYAERPNQLNEEWWNSTVNRLADWRAIRSPKPPNTKKAIFKRGLDRLPRLDQHYRLIRQRAGRQEPLLDNLTWEDIAPLFDVLCEIKESRSPVMASKLGHFMFPRAFIVIDNEATTAGFPYEVVWCGLQASWQRFQEKEVAKQMLAAEIRKSTNNIHVDYPFETKILEMWLIGYKHR